MMLIAEKFLILIIVVTWIAEATCHRQFTRNQILALREEVRAMFQHAYDGYLRHASDYDELRPLTCDGINTWGSYSLTLIDALDTLATMGNFTEFRRVAKLLEHKINFDKDINVSVFETNIRIVGGLIGAHLMSKRAGVEVEVGWPCTGPLLRMAEDVARRLLPAFDTATGMPYGTVNLRHGVPDGETPVTCTAGVGTFLIEFGTLSRLTGNPIYEEVALNAVYSLWGYRSAIGLFGNHIDVQTGRWTAQDAGIGAGVDSFYEYLVKAALLLNRPKLMEMFHEARAAIDKYLKRDDWYVWAGMHKGKVTLPVFQSLEAYWPGLLSMIGDIKPAIRTLSKYISVWKQYGFLPEFYNIPTGEATVNRESYPLRPELAESTMYLYRATKNKFLLEVGENMVRSIENSAKTPCGYATIRNVLTHEKDNRMESFFLAETTKYLYLLFDEDNFLHNDGGHGELHETPNGQCVIHAGAYIFNTEAHPVDMSALFCCHDIHDDLFANLENGERIEDRFVEDECRDREQVIKKNAAKYECGSEAGTENKYTKQYQDSKISIDIEVFNEHDAPASDELIRNFERIQKERDSGAVADSTPLTVSDLNTFFTASRSSYASVDEVLAFVVAFMKRLTLEPSQIHGLHIFEESLTANLGAIEKDYEGKTKSLWQLFQMKHRYVLNSKLNEALGVLSPESNEDLKFLDDVLLALDTHEKTNKTPTNVIEQKIFAAIIEYQNVLVNTTAMQDFLLKILINGTPDKKRSYKPLLSEEELLLKTKSMTDGALPAELKIFENLRRVIKLKKRIIKIYQKLEIAMKKSKSKKREDLALDEYKEILTRKSTNADEGFQKTTSSDDLLKQTSEAKDDSIWSQLVQTILRTTTSTQRSKFDEKLLLEKTRKSLKKYEDIEPKYELLTCRAPSFIERLAYRDFYP